MTDGSTIWYLDFVVGYSDNAEALALAAEVARAVQAPAAPITGSSEPINGERSTAAMWALLAGTLGAGAGAGLALNVRRGSAASR